MTYPSRSVELARIQGTRASQHLDLVRGLAAIAVLIYHIRYRFFYDFGDLVVRDPLALGWYGATAFGHDAVMVFFVLSGFLIGSSVLRDHRNANWSWRPYLASRFARLYVVLIPGLAVTLLCDRIGLHLAENHVVYTGALRHWQHDFFDVSSTGTWDALLGNLFFLQGIVSPSFGSNAALWSLSFEFWYYLAFPILLLLFFSTKPLGLRAGYASLALILLMVFAPHMARYFPIWLLGVVVGLLPASGWLARRPIPWLTGAALGFVVLVTLEHSTRVKRVLGESVYALDWVTGLAFALCLYGILHDRRPAFAGRYATISKALASCSFTLYVIHLPILVLVRALATADTPWLPSVTSIGVSLALAAGVFALAYGMAAVTEAHTNAVRRFLSKRS